MRLGARNCIEDFSIIDAAVGDIPGNVSFWSIAQTNGQTQTAGTASHLIGKLTAPWCEIPETYCGRTLVKNSAGWGGVVVDVITLEEILRAHRVVDLIDMDIQGMEASIIKTEANFLASKVKRIHVATHSNAIEASIRETMKSLAWKCE